VPTLPASAPRLVLVVDDDPDAAELAAMHFGHFGYEVEIAEDPADALTAVEASHPDLVVMDLMSPGKDGPELLASLRAHDSTRDCPIVVSSMLDRAEYPDGIFAALPKPVRRDQVARIVAALRGVTPAR
jgi:CheY-like chemotaxis protein